MESYKNPDRSTLRSILQETKSIAVVGISNKENRPSYRVSAYLQQQGYRIIPVNPTIESVLGSPAFGDLGDIEESPDVVCIFRRSEEVLPIVTAALRLKPRVIWMQDNVVNQEAAQVALEAGIQVVMNDCMLRQHMSLIGVS